MLLGIIYIILSMLVGWQIVRLLPLKVHQLEAAAMCAAIGFNVTAWIAFVCCLILGFQIGLIATFVALLVAQSCQLLLPQSLQLTSEYYHRRYRKLAIFMGMFTLIVLLILTDMTYQLPGPKGDWISNGFSAGDFALHSGLIKQFSSGNNVDLVSPVYLRHRLNYPFLPDFYSAIILRLSSNWRLAFEIPSIVMISALLQLVWSFAYRLLRRPASTWIAFLVFVYAGSTYAGIQISFYALAHGGAGFVDNMLNVLYGMGPRYYNFFIAEFLPQHSFLYGMPMLLCSLTLALTLYRGKMSNVAARKTGIIAGVIIGLMPLIHTHSFLMAIGLLSLSSIGMLICHRRLPAGWLAMIAAAAIVSLPQLLWQFMGSFGSHFVRFIFGWKLLGSQEAPPINWFVHWGGQIGFILIFMLIGWIWLRKYSVSLEIWFCYWAGVILFALCNLIIFQPAYYDNMKFFTYAVWLISFPMAYVFVIWLQYRAGRIVVGLLLYSLMASGLLAICIAPVFLGTVYMSKAELFLAATLDRKLPIDAYFIIAATNHRPINLIAGRKEMIHIDSWVNLYDQNAKRVIADRDSIMHGKAEAPDLIRKYGVTYAAINEVDANYDGANLAFFEKNYRLAYHEAGWWIFDLRQTPNH